MAAKTALEKLGSDAHVVLDYLLLHGSMTFGFSNPPLPAGMSGQAVREILDRCLEENLVTRSENATPGGRESAFTIASGMKAALDELL